MQEHINNLLELAKEKKIPDKDIKTAIAILMSSASMQAMEICQKSKNDAIEYSLDSIEKDLQKIKTKNDLVEFKIKLDSALSKTGTSFQKTFEEIFLSLIVEFSKKIS